MTELLARDQLTVSSDGDEVPGLSVYGLAARGGRLGTTFPAHAWYGAPEVQAFLLYGVGWEVANWDFPIVIWPKGNEFVEAIRETLGALISDSCRVAWIGAEGLPFCDPPQLFDPKCMSGGVLAWMTDDGRFSCPLDPDRSIDPVDDEQLLDLRAHARGLADATG